MLERLEVLQAGLGPDQLRRLFKFADGDGGLLAVVGERTVPVARLVAGPLRREAFPLRLCYAGPVLANASGRFAGRRETWQVGAELVGARGVVADAEVIALTARCLEAAGLTAYQLEVGHSEFFAGLLAGLGVGAAAEAAIRDALAGRDLVALRRVLDSTPLRAAERDLLLRFPALRGGPEILEAARPLVRHQRSARALAELAEVAELVAAHGLGGAVNLDLGAIRDLDYYTGVTFEAYGADLGRPLAAGGRYDQLLKRFGRPAPATGFVIQLDLLADALVRAGAAPALPTLHAAVSWTAAGRAQALQLAAGLRLFGMRAAVATEPQAGPAARRWWAAGGAVNLVHCSGAERVLWVDRRGARRLPAEQLVGRLAGTRRP